jgi:Ni/Co efflux regulator RcnB
MPDSRNDGRCAIIQSARIPWSHLWHHRLAIQSEEYTMSTRATLAFIAAAAVALGIGMTVSQAQEHGAAMHRPEPPRAPEPHAGPRGYDRPAEPKGWNNRPAANFDRAQYQHNFRAARSFHVGPYHRPAGWAAHRWAYGQILPRAYFGSSYFISDYWLFALEIPPAGYEWVRDDTDALLVNVDTGEVLQVEYDVFA